MSTPYRTAPPVIDDEDIPDFGNTPRPGRELLWVATRALLFVVVWAVDRNEHTTFTCEMYLFGLAVVALIFVLERPVRAWFEARRLRAVVAGVAALEAKVSASE